MVLRAYQDILSKVIPAGYDIHVTTEPQIHLHVISNL